MPSLYNRHPIARAGRLVGGGLAAVWLGGCQAPAALQAPPDWQPGAVFSLAKLDEAASPTALAGRPVIPPSTSAPTSGPLTAPGGSTTGGGGSAPAAPEAPSPPGDLHGRVFAQLPGEADVAVPNATVAVYGAGLEQSVTTDAEGRYALTGVPTGHPLLVTAEGMAPSLVAGWSAGELDLHVAKALSSHLLADSAIRVSGNVVTSEGARAAGAIVMGSNQSGARFGPLTADADGHFEGMAELRQGASPTNLAVFAFMQTPYQTVRSLGLTEGVTVGADAPPVAVRLVESSGAWRMAVDGPGGHRSGSAIARAGNGFAVTLAAWGDEPVVPDCPYFALTGAAIEARMDLASLDGTARSTWDGPVTGPGTVTAAMLPYPGAPDLSRGLVPDMAVGWAATPGADGYRLSLHARDLGAPLWEAYVTRPGTALRALPARAPDFAQLIAFKGGSIRQVASVGLPRRLRLLDPDVGPGAYATRTVTLHP